MKKLILTLIFCLYVSPLWAATITDDFNRGDSTDIGANWDNGYFSGGRNCQILSNLVRPGATGTSCYESWNANSFSGDQTAQIHLTTFQGSDTAASVLLKASDPASSTDFYRCGVTVTGDAFINKAASGSQSTLNSNNGNSFAGGDDIKCTAEGASPVNLTLYQNGNPILTYSDSSSPLSGTRIGLSVYNFSDGDVEIDDFDGGDIAPPAPSGNKAQVVIFQ